MPLNAFPVAVAVGNAVVKIIALHNDFLNIGGGFDHIVLSGIFVLSGKGLTDHLHMREFLQNLASLYRNILADTASCQLVVPQLQLGGTVHDLVRCVHSKPGGHGEVVCPCRDDLTALHLLFAHVAAQVVVDLYHAHAVSNKLEVTTLELVFTEPGDHLIGDLLICGLLILEPVQKL